MKKNANEKEMDPIPMAVIETPDTATAAKAPVAGSSPTDADGCEAVTIIITADSEDRADLAIRSMKRNLLGVDAEVVVVSPPDKDAVEQAVQAAKTRRVILMTGNMLILNPVTIHDIGIKKAIDHMPVLLYKSGIYAKSSTLDAVRPLPIGDWRTDPWLLPVVSGNPDIPTLRRLADFKRFIYISDKSWTPAVVKFLEERFPK